MKDVEIKQKAIETYELGIHMSKVFTQVENNKEYMIMAIAACISGIVKQKKESTYSLMPIYDFDASYFMSLRKEKGYTLRQTEDATGISNSYLSQFENGKIKKPSQNVVNKLLNFYNNGIVIKKDNELINQKP